ncbi:MAG TPA: metallophosphoesterase [Burkholderiaceae bacterium]|nr:metallophosphoesterase [Burkholderiaceae bacterium]
MTQSKLVQTLPSGPLDIIGDIHGELNALEALLDTLEKIGPSYKDGNRKLVFIGDFCDRGPDSPGVIKRVQELMDNGQAVGILGNHEINLMNNDPKDGSGWFFDQRVDSDNQFYQPYQRAAEEDKKSIVDFFNTLPIALERPDLRIVHATWHADSIEKIRQLPLGSVAENYYKGQKEARLHAERIGLWARYQEQRQRWSDQLEDVDTQPPFLDAIAEYEIALRDFNPFKVLTSGLERPIDEVFYSGNRWRFSDRVPWWDDYTDSIPVVIGHYWRLFNPLPGQVKARYSMLFDDIHPYAWHGDENRVFCVDYSVGARWRERVRHTDRKVDPQESRFRLGALRWPENEIVFDTGHRVPAR